MLQSKIVRFSSIENVFQSTIRDIKESFIFDQNTIEIYSDNLQKTRRAFQEEILKRVRTIR